ncbi:TlpA family protein disulfide reductase [bacterium]|nr:TlpA family protein disulfide reductase [bacterium]
MKKYIFIVVFISFTLLGNSSFEQFYGKKLFLLNFWATWCTPCKHELPLLQNLYEKYNKDGFNILSISMDDSGEEGEVLRVKNMLKLSFPIILEADGFVVQKYNPTGTVPYSILFDEKGDVIAKFSGFSVQDMEILEKTIVSILNTKNIEKNLLKTETNIDINSNSEKKNSSNKKGTIFDYNIKSSLYYTLYHPDSSNEMFKNYEFLKTRTSLSSNYDIYGVGLSFNSDNFLSKTNYIRDNYSDFEDYRVEKIFLTAKNKKISISLGDFYINQGKGLSISFQKQDELGIDTTLQGVKGEWQFLKNSSLSFFGGRVNNLNLDTNTNGIYSDKNDIITGAIIKSKISIVEFGLYYDHIFFDEQEFTSIYQKPDGYERHTMGISGGYISLSPTSKLKIYTEGVIMMDHYYDSEDKIDSQYGFYGFWSYNGAKLSILNEFKKYKHLQIGYKTDLDYYSPKSRIDPNDPNSDMFRNSIKAYGVDSVFYNQPPTLEGESEKVFDVADDVYGTRLKFGYNLNKTFSPYTSYYLGRTDKKEITTHHALLGTEIFFKNIGDKINSYLSYRYESGFGENSKFIHNYFGGGYDLSFTLSSIFSIESKGYLHFVEENFPDSDEIDNYQDIETSLTALVFNKLYLSYYFNRYTSKIKNTQNHYQGGEIKYRFLSDSFVRVFYGEIRGGLKCIGGVCREYAPFYGFKGDVTISF